MTFEGKELDIPIKGIIRAGSDNLCADGAMNEVVGMEYKDGSYVPYGELYDGEFRNKNISKAYIHKTNSKNIQIFVSEDNGTVYFIDGTGELKPIGISGAIDIKFVGDMICVTTSDAMKYAIYRNGKYILQTNDTSNADPFPIYFQVARGLYDKDQDTVTHCGIISHKHTKTTDVKNYDSFAKDWGTILKTLTNNEIASSALTSIRGKVRDKGGLTGFFLVCAAYRLNDGTYSIATPPVLMSPPNILHRDYETGKVFISNSATKPNNVDSDYFSPKHIPAVDTRSYVGEINKSKSDYNVCFISDEMYETQLTDTSNWTDKMIDYSEMEEVAYCNTKKETITYPTVLKTVADNITEANIEKFYTDLYFLNKGNLPKLAKFILQPIRYSTGVRYNSDKDAYCINEIASCVSNYLQVLFHSKIPENSNIEGLSIFISPEILPYLDDKDKLDRRGCAFYSDSSLSPNSVSHEDDFCCGYSFLPTYKSSETIIKEIKQINTLYLVKDFTKKEVNDNKNKYIKIDLKGVLGDNLLVREQLPLTAFARPILGSIIGGHLFAYNYRLHNYNYTKKSDEIAYATNYSYKYYGGVGQYPSKYTPAAVDSIEYEIAAFIYDPNYPMPSGDASNISVRCVKFSNYNLPYILAHNPAIFYPNTNAKGIQIRVKTSVGSTEKLGEIDRKLGESKLGMACYINPYLKPQTVVLLDNTNGTTLPFQTPRFIEEAHKNGMIVSETAFPMSFPAKYTYRIGNGTILGMARLTIALSQDTFGRYPLLVFCTDGIYSMSIDDTGNGAYTNIAPFSREVCVNPKTICEIDGAVLFVSDKGLMIATQSNVQEFCPQLNGYIHFSPEYTNPTSIGHQIFRTIISNKQVTMLSSAIDKQDFIDHLKDKDTIISYVSLKNKVIVYNKVKDYVYWIDIPTRNVTKLNIRIEFDDNNYPSECYFKHNTEGHLIYMSFPYVADSDATTQCMFQTRPIKIQQGLKTAFRVVLTGYFHGQHFDSSSEKNFAELVVLGSLDGEHWIPIGIKEKCLDEPFHNLGCITDRVSCNYIMILFAGRLYPDSHIDSIKITNESKYNNKLKV